MRSFSSKARQSLLLHVRPGLGDSDRDNSYPARSTGQPNSVASLFEKFCLPRTRGARDGDDVDVIHGLNLISDSRRERGRKMSSLPVRPLRLDYFPDPLKLTVCGLLAALSLSDSLAVWLPVKPG